MLYKNNNYRTVVLIPARYASSRFPGKPLAKILNKEMILWVAELSSKAIGKSNVYVVTDDFHIKNIVEFNGYQVILSENIAMTGTDRIAEAALKINADVYINVQGDEPLLNPNDIVKVRDFKIKNMNFIINCYTYINGENENSINIPKVVTNEAGELLYISRIAIPGTKDKINKSIRFKKQVCIYAFTKEELLNFNNYGRKSDLEEVEDIEILRFFELNRKILMIETMNGSLSVDIPSDIVTIENILNKK